MYVPMYMCIIISFCWGREGGRQGEVEGGGGREE